MMEGSRLDQVAASFVTQYFEGILAQPASLASCYGPDSTMCVTYAPNNSVEAKGPEEAKEKLTELNAYLTEEKKVQVLQTEIFPSFDNSALMITEGIVVSPSSSQNFTQTVILRNNGAEGEFYIRNDVWRFGSEDSEVAAESDAVESEEEEEAVEEAESAAESEAAEESAAASQQMDESVNTATSEPAAAVEEAPVEEKPKGPVNWASRARAAPAPAASTSAPQRVSDEKPKKVAPKKEEPKEVKSESKGRPPRQEAKSMIAMKVKDVTDADIRAALPDSLKNSLLSLRNHSDSNSRVFLDFSNPDALEILKGSSLKIAGKTASVEAQKKR